MDQQGPRTTERLNELLRAELAAVLAYQHSLRSMDGRLGDDSTKILGFAAGHQRTVAALQVCIRALGGVAAAEAGRWGSFALLRDAVSVQQLLDAEKTGLAEYQAALPSLAGEAHELVEHELIPRQRQHVATLSKLLADLTPA
jgi:hypothetical protein